MEGGWRVRGSLAGRYALRAYTQGMPPQKQRAHGSQPCYPPPPPQLPPLMPPAAPR